MSHLLCTSALPLAQKIVVPDMLSAGVYRGNVCATSTTAHADGLGDRAHGRARRRLPLIDAKCRHPLLAQRMMRRKASQALLFP